MAYAPRFSLLFVAGYCSCRTQPSHPERSMLETAASEWQTALPSTENASTLSNWPASWNDPSLSELLFGAAK
ncbi:hypothetical protein EJG51_009635 [Undibacterium piscinae]|uniref:Uncharacterized protein n=1 Tax=Undibacterium piscinae TaxID=2495591 RepID=A0A6M4A4E6_9BURK|nr:hypothetical protein EJG51_009635 [Undibacterium piscinae]